jgi:hypothetical protein
VKHWFAVNDDEHHAIRRPDDFGRRVLESVGSSPCFGLRKTQRRDEVVE